MSVFGLLLAAVLGSGQVANGGSVSINTVDADRWAGISIDVEAWNRPTVQIEREPVQGDSLAVGAEISHDGSVTTVTATYRGEEKTSFFGLVHDGSHIRVRWIVRMPASAALSVRAANDPIVANGITAALKLRTSNGNIDVSGAGASVNAQSSNGNVRVRLARIAGTPQILLRSSNGDVTLSVPPNFKTPISAHTSNGTVTNPLKDATGSGTATMRSSNGDIVVTVSN